MIVGFLVLPYQSYKIYWNSRKDVYFDLIKKYVFLGFSVSCWAVWLLYFTLLANFSFAIGGRNIAEISVTWKMWEAGLQEQHWKVNISSGLSRAPLLELPDETFSLIHDSVYPLQLIQLTVYSRSFREGYTPHANIEDWKLSFYPFQVS